MDKTTRTEVKYGALDARELASELRIALDGTIPDVGERDTQARRAARATLYRLAGQLAGAIDQRGTDGPYGSVPLRDLEREAWTD